MIWIMIITEGQGVGGHVGDESSSSLFFFNEGLKCDFRAVL